MIRFLSLSFLSVAIQFSTAAFGQLDNPILSPMAFEFEKQKEFEAELLFPWMEQKDSIEMNQWFYNQSKKTVQSLLNKKPLWKKVRKDLRGLMVDAPSNPRIGDRLSETERVVIVDEGLGKPLRVELQVDGKTEKVYFQTPEKDPFSQSVLSADVSPDRQWLLIPVSQSGSIDGHTLYVYDFKTGSLLWKIPNISSHWSWLNSRQIDTGRYGKESNVSIIIDFSQTKDGLPLIKENDLAFWTYSNDAKDLFFLGVDQETSNNMIVHLSSGKRHMFKKRAYNRIQFADEERVIVTGSDGNQNLLAMMSFGVETKIINVELLMTRVSRVEKISGGFLIIGHKGIIGSLQYIDQYGQTLGTVDLPVGVSLRKVRPMLGGATELLNVELQSHVVKSNEISINLSTMRFWDFETNSEILSSQIFSKMHWDGKRHWVTYVLNSISADGTEIPALVTHRKHIPLNGNHPTLIEVYGGFGIPVVNSRFDPVVKKMFLNRKEFSQGGVFVSPALRGGGEFGPTWHSQARELNKIKTFEDLIAVTEELHARGVTRPEKTVITGTSNGGYTVAATGTLRPDLFALVMPVNGVLDQVNKGYLDKRFGLGWKYEYGDISDSKQMETFLRGMSPVHNQGVHGVPPRYLIVNGQSDSRVNAIHSWTLMEVLNQNFPENDSLLLTMKHGGHWPNSMGFQDVHGYRLSARIWTEVIDSVK